MLAIFILPMFDGLDIQQAILVQVTAYEKIILNFLKYKLQIY